MRILVADHQQKVRHALSVWLQKQPGWQVVGNATDAASLFTRTTMDHPDLLLLDWELPGLRHGDVVRHLRSFQPRPLIIAISAHPERQNEALENGVDYFVSKVDSPHRLMELMHSCEQSLVPGKAAIPSI